MYTPAQILGKIGFTNKEKSIFLKCMEYGGLTVTAIQRHTYIPRTTIYDILQKLELKGYITKVKKQKTLTFFAISIQELMALMEDKIHIYSKNKDLLQNNIGKFQEMMKGSHKTPQVKSYQGKEVTTLIYNQVKYAHQVRTIYSIETANAFYGGDLVETLHTSHKEISTHKKVLLVHEESAKNEKERLSYMGFDVKILPPGFPIHADIMILDEKVLFISYGETLHALEIQQPIFVHTQRAMFDLIWDSIE